MKCSAGGDSSIKCDKDATWDGLCEEHGGKRPTMIELMTLLGKVTGWGESVALSVRYSEALRHVSHDETERTGKFYFSVGANICGDDKMNVSAHDEDFTAAVWKLCQAVPERIDQSERWCRQKREQAHAHVIAFIERPKKGPPYR